VHDDFEHSKKFLYKRSISSEKMYYLLFGVFCVEMWDGYWVGHVGLSHKTALLPRLLKIP
jgi:hypothetical protein